LKAGAERKPFTLWVRGFLFGVYGAISVAGVLLVRKIFGEGGVFRDF